jgi:hypothetical protein
MAYFHPAWVEHQRRHWMRPDAERYVRPDAHRFMPPGAPRWLGKDAVRYFWPDHKTQPARTRHDETEHARDVAFLRELAARREDLLRLRRELAAINAELKFRRFFRSLKAGFNPNQPRLPRGNPGGGQWTSEGGSGGGAGDPRILSDATPDDDWQPGAQYAQIRARGGPILINGQMVVPTPGQAARLAVVEARARDAISRVHEVDPNWRPRPSAYESVEGLSAPARQTPKRRKHGFSSYNATGLGRVPLLASQFPHEDPGATSPSKSIAK